MGILKRNESLKECQPFDSSYCILLNPRNNFCKKGDEGPTRGESSSSSWPAISPCSAMHLPGPTYSFWEDTQTFQPRQLCSRFFSTWESHLLPHLLGQLPLPSCLLFFLQHFINSTLPGVWLGPGKVWIIGDEGRGKSYKNTDKQNNGWCCLSCT